MDHSVYGYLQRRSDCDLEIILQFCLEQAEFDFYEPIAIMAIDILDERKNPEVWQQKSIEYRNEVKLAKEKAKTNDHPKRMEYFV